MELRSAPMRTMATYVPGSATAGVARQSMLERCLSHSRERTYGTPRCSSLTSEPAPLTQSALDQMRSGPEVMRISIALGPTGPRGAASDRGIQRDFVSLRRHDALLTPSSSVNALQPGVGGILLVGVTEDSDAVPRSVPGVDTSDAERIRLMETALSISPHLPIQVVPLADAPYVSPRLGLLCRRAETDAHPMETADWGHSWSRWSRR